MTDDVPVSDVLLEATEYLCKLGTNLKLRSENLKEKRIARSKLKNTHAVLKAADKLLLICELSKKSLENVEVGVKKILRVCARDQGPITVKSASFKREIEYFYIKDGSNKLRMSQKISLAHFKSVNVKAKNMPLSKIEKYPVYFDCKLYRRRKKKELEGRLKKISKNNAGSSESGVTCLENLDKIEVDAEEDEKSKKDRSSEEQDNKESSSSRHSSTENHEEIMEDEEKSKTKSEYDNSTNYVEKEKYNNSKSESKINKCDFKDQKEKSRDIKEDKPEKPQKNGENSHDKKDKDQSESKKKKKHARIVHDCSDEQLSEVVDDSPKKPSDKEEIDEAVKDRDETKKNKHAKLVYSSDEQALKVKKESPSKVGDKKSNPEAAEERNEAKIIKSERRDKTHDVNMDDSKKKHSNKEIHDARDDQPVKKEKHRAFDKENSIETVGDSSDDAHRHKKRKCPMESSDEESKKERYRNRQKNKHGESDKRDKDQSEPKRKKKHVRIVEDSSDEQPSEVMEKSPIKPSYSEKSLETLKDSNDTKIKHAKSVDSNEEYASKIKKESPSKLADKGRNHEAKGVESSKDKTDDEENENRDESQNKNCERAILDSSDDQHLEEETNRTFDKENSPESVEDSSDDSHRHKKRRISHQMESSDEDKKDKELVNDSENPAAQPQKPLLKLVDLSKLLKPDVLQADFKKNECQSQPTNNNIKPELSRKERKLQEKNFKEKHFWEQKRKESLAFKPKKFHVFVCRLPEFNNNFLVRNKIIKITQQGETIATRSKDKIVTFQDSDKEDQLSDKSIRDKRPEGKENVSTNCTPDMNKVKSALLDSDSDKEEDTAVILAVAEKVKKTLLNDTDDSDSDGKIKEKNQSEFSVVNCKESELNSTAITNDNIVLATETKTIDLRSIDMENQMQSSDNKQLDMAEPSQVTENQGFSSKTSKNKDVTPVGSDNEKSEQTQSSDKITEKPDKTQPSKEKISSSQISKNIDTTPVGSDTEEKSKRAQSSDIESEKPDETELPKVTEQESSSETSKNKDTTPVDSDKVKKSPEKSPITPRSKKKRKNMMESMHAKKMLLTYSSSSDTEDENLKDAIKEIKNSLLEGSDEDVIEKVRENHRKKLVASSSDDDDDDVPIIQKRKACEEPNKIGDNETRENNENSSQVNAKADEDTSSSSKMGRSKTKPSSSSQNSDTQDTDKDIDGLTNLKTLAKSSRRRDSTSTSQAEDTGAKTRSKTIPKVPAIKMADLLQASTGSSGESAGEGEGNDDLPPMTLNGSDALDLGKDQLLDDSDASSTHNKSSDDVKQDGESEDDDNPKAKRRKAIAISSDSEGGGRRKSAPKSGPKSSDFSESEEDSEEKRSKRKKKRDSDSDASARSSDSGGKKKRRRIKQVDDSDASGSGSENEGRKHGRKNIRKVMGKDQLEEATKKAARREKERVARIAERQKLYNNLQFDESGKPDEVVLDKVVLDFDPETKEPIIAVDRGLVKKLKPHQANGIKFMWDACFESAKRIKKDKGSGCILAHCMGLGKTLQVVTLTHTLLAHSELTGVRRVLVVCPLSTVLNWVNEFNMWLKHTESDCEVDVYELSRYKQNSERAWQLQQWFNGGGVCVLGYEMFRNLSADNPKKFRKKMLSTFQQSLVSPGPDLVVCDEGHLLKNEKTSLSQSMNRVKTLRRIVLTGTPLQNNLKEYYCMVQFVKPNLLGKYNEYLNRFVNPITNGQYTDSTEQDIRVMKRRSHVLHKMLDGAVQRRDYGVLAPFLPPKHENVLFITLSEVQIKLYQHYLDNYSRRPAAGKSGFLFPDFQSLQRIWTHPLVLKYNSERYEILQQKKRDKEEEEDDSEGSLADFIDDDSTPDESSTEESSDDLSDASDGSRKKSKKKKAKKEKKSKPPRRGTRANPVEVDPEEKPVLELEEVRNENPTEWWMRLVDEEELEDMRHSHKLILLFDILRQCEAIGDKLLVFSQSLYSLDLIEHFLGKVDEATQEARIDPKLGNHVGSWSPGVDYFRLDGSTSCENRSLWCKHFNREDNPRARLFLISTRAGGLGINLVAANRVVIFDVSWNPSHDVQSIFRVYRFGQKKPCYVYRFLAMGTMEEKIYERQVTKQAISKRVIDEQQIDRHYAENDLAELYKFEPKPPEPRPLPPLPKDRLFAEMLREHDKEIYKYHEHDSLLENKEEETLTEEERKAAWEDFENEKNRPPPAPFPSVWPMHNGMAPNPLLAQQQQQLAYAAIVAMLRKDMPNVNEAQIRDMLPLIYNANPALMQKMGEIYKYAPGMMNPMMNAMGGAAMGGMGGTSGLQYEPPWQRQQQDQQQMRLQQLMQHQNQSMNAKYYAGGLGSRDPVAMALQQQAAREIMLGEAAGRGRPRGRPPLARAPAAPADVVNLDSD